jgi:5-methylcytosine-specific restriction enzyme B
MARRIQARDLSPILTAARTWINDCLVGDGSVFSPSPLWKPEPIDDVTRAFVDHPDEGDDAFLVKLARQVTGCTPAAKQLLAEMLWAMFLFPSNMRATTKREQVVQVWGWSGGALDPNHPLLADAVLAGIGSGGQATCCATSPSPSASNACLRPTTVGKSLSGSATYLRPHPSS